jgi:hypothetical protein
MTPETKARMGTSLTDRCTQVLAGEKPERFLKRVYKQAELDT